MRKQEILFLILNIYYEGKGVGAVTNLDGEYSISYHEGWNELTFSMVGYSTQVLKVSSKTRTLNVKMRPIWCWTKWW